MRKSAITLAVLAGTISVPMASVAAQAQLQERVIVRDGATTGLAPGEVVGIPEDVQPRFRQYIVQENVPNYTVPGTVMVGVKLPEIGVSYYDVPQQYGAQPYRYTRVNDRYVVIDPVTRRVLQVIE